MLPLGSFYYAALSPPLGFAVGQQLSAEISPKLIRDAAHQFCSGLDGRTVQRSLRNQLEKNLPKALKTLNKC